MVGGKNNGGKRLGLLGGMLSWDSEAEKGRQTHSLWGGSRDQGHHRRGENLPKSKNGPRSSEAKKGGWFSK
jgi:hypothetical protein